MRIEKSLFRKLQKAKEGRGKKRAVSPVIATLLLIAIAVAAGIVLYIFVTGFAGSLTTVSPPSTQGVGAEFICVNGDRAGFVVAITNGGTTDIVIPASGVTVVKTTGELVWPTNNKAIKLKEGTCGSETTPGTEDSVTVSAGETKFIQISLSDTSSPLATAKFFTVRFSAVTTVKGEAVTINQVVFRTPS
jgi:flagellin-like protein